jgi:P27 family predicted phage terminase small subunit
MPPKPTPTAKLAHRGSWRARTRESEPKPNVPNSLPPSELEGRAAEIWDDLAPKLYNIGLLTEADIPAFRRYCRTYALWERLYDKLDDDAGRNAVLTLAKVDEMVRKQEAAFGLTPSDRTGIQVAETEESVDVNRFFKSA